MLDYKVLTEGGLVITNISHNPLLSTRKGLTLWGNEWEYLFHKVGKEQVERGRGKRTTTWTSTLAAFWGKWVLGRSMYIYWRRQWHPPPVLLPGKSHGQGSLVGYSPWGHLESDTTEQLHFHFSLSCIGEGKGNPLQCFCLENPRDEGAWWAAVYGVAQSQTRLKQLSRAAAAAAACIYTFIYTYIHTHIYIHTHTKESWPVKPF